MLNKKNALAVKLFLARFPIFYVVGAVVLLRIATAIYDLAAAAPLSTLLHIPTAMDSRPRAVIHIGPHKTGSSYIQQKMCLSKSFLASRQWTVPICAQCTNCFDKHFAGVAFELQRKQRLAEVFSCVPDPVECFKKAIEVVCVHFPFFFPLRTSL